MRRTLHLMRGRCMPPAEGVLGVLQVHSLANSHLDARSFVTKVRGEYPMRKSEHKGYENPE